MIKETDDINELFAAVKTYLENNNYKDFYYRLWARNEKTIIDFGSYNEFFVIDSLLIDQLRE